MQNANLSTEQLVDETTDRIQREIDHYGGTLPDVTSAVWHGYIAALLEWRLISVEGHAGLVKLLNPVDNQPELHDAMSGLWLGRPEDP